MILITALILVLYMEMFYYLGQNIVFVKYFISQGYRKFFLGTMCIPADILLSPFQDAKTVKRGASSRKLREYLERRLDNYDIVTLIIDGRSFGRRWPFSQWYWALLRGYGECCCVQGVFEWSHGAGVEGSRRSSRLRILWAWWMLGTSSLTQLRTSRS